MRVGASLVPGGGGSTCGLDRRVRVWGFHTHKTPAPVCVCASLHQVQSGLRLGPQDAGKGSFIWHRGPVDRPPRLDVALLLFLPFGLSRRGGGLA